MRANYVKLLLLGLTLSAVTAEAQVSVNINVGPPPIVFQAPPPVVVVPSTPVFYVPDINYNVFVYEKRYYSFHEGNWFLAKTYRGPWTAVPVKSVPRAVIGVPVKYYKVPPGHAKKMDGNGQGHGQGNQGCPPGLAKQGRC